MRIFLTIKTSLLSIFWDLINRFNNRLINQVEKIISKYKKVPLRPILNNNETIIPSLLLEIPKNESYSWLYSNFPLLHQFQFLIPASLQQRITLLKGKIQAGKTAMILAICQLGLYYNISSIVIVRKIDNDKDQMKDRAREFCQRYKTNLSKVITVAEHITADSNLNLQQIEWALMGRDSKLIICMCNPEQISRVSKAVINLSKQNCLARYFLIIDEADDLLYGKNSETNKFYQHYLQLFNLATRIVFSTGTIYDVIFKEHNLLNCNIIDLSVEPSYKGIEHFIPRYIPNTIARDKIDPEMKALYKELISTYPNYHPVIILHKTTTFIKQQKKIQDNIKSFFPQVTTIVHNGSDTRLYSNQLTEPSLTISGYYTVQNNKMFSFRKLGINKILQYLKDQGGTSRFPYIVIISGRLADRGLSFVSTDYRWHLTHQIYLPAKTARSTSANLLQALRLCGKYQDNLKLYLITTEEVYSECLKADRMQDKVYNLAKEEEDGLFLDCLRKQVHKVEEIPKSEKKSMLKYVQIASDKKGDIFLIVNHPSNGFNTRYTTIVNYLKDHSGVWYLRANVISKLTSDPTENTNYRGIIHPPRIKHKTKVNSETVAGLLMKIEQGEWKMRYNK
jgi:hypothetical protein